MIVTLKDVAELAGVSRSAVSRTYTEGASVSLKTREKVKKAALELGYSPNALASSLTTGRTKMIGFTPKFLPTRYVERDHTGDTSRGDPETGVCGPIQQQGVPEDI